MGNSDNTLSRRQLAVLSAAALALPAAALAATQISPNLGQSPPEPIDEVYRLIEQHRAAAGRFEQRDEWVERLEWSAPDDVEIYYYSDPAAIEGFPPARIARIKAGDEWAISSGLDHCTALRNEALEHLEALEIQLKTAAPRTIGGLIALCEWLDQRERETHCRGTGTALEQADRAVYRTIIASLRALAVA